MDTIVFSGCGGGYDIFGCLPLYYDIDQNKTNVIITNLSFTNVNTLEELSVKYSGKVVKICDSCYEVFPGDYADNVFYFPEYMLAKQLNHSVCAMCDYETVDKIMTFYNCLLDKCNAVSAFYLVDGGSDVLLSGKETGLATYVEDMMNLKAIKNIVLADNSKIKKFYVAAIGLNVECGHGVLEHELVDRLKYLEDSDIMINKELLDLVDPKVKFYYDTVLKCRPGHTLVQSFVVCALEGKTGLIVPHFEHIRIGVNKYVNVSDLTRTYVICDGLKLADSIVYLHLIGNQTTSDEVGELETCFKDL